MNHKIFSYALGCLVIGACQAQPTLNFKESPKTAPDAAGIPVAPVSTASSSGTPAPAATPPQKDPKQCRALLNLSDGSVADVRFGQTTKVEAGKGFVLQDKDSLYAVDLLSISKEDKNRYGKLSRSWQKIIATPLPTGKPAVWLDGDPGLNLPDEHAVMDFYQEQRYQILGNVGPFLMISDFGNGFTGGAHDYDEGSYKAMRYPSTEDQGLGFLGPEVHNALQKTISEIDAERQEGLTAPKDLKGVALTFGVKKGALSMTLRHNIFCCSWAENHNQLDVEAPLTKIPKGLQDQLSDEKEPLFTSPDGCALGYSQGKLVGKVEQNNPIPIEGLSGELRGLSWISLEHPFSVKQLEDARQIAQSMK